MDSRTSSLIELLHFSRPVADVMDSLSVFGWDSDVELVALEPSHITSVLHRFLSGKLLQADVEDWANAIECRDDIGFDPNSFVATALHELANPILTRPLTRQSATDWVATLHAAAT